MPYFHGKIVTKKTILKLIVPFLSERACRHNVHSWKIELKKESLLILINALLHMPLKFKRIYQINTQD